MTYVRHELVMRPPMSRTAGVLFRLRSDGSLGEAAMERADAWQLTERVPHETGKGDPFAAAVRATRMPMIITDPRQHDNPIVFVNDAFLTLTGYERHEIMGANCRFLQGVDTDPQAVRRVADAIASRSDIAIDLLNYRKDGTPFWNALYVSPVFTDAGELQYFFASQLDVTERMEALAAKTALLHEVDHRVKNNLQMISALIMMQADTIADPAVRRSLDTMLNRIEAISTVHRRLYQSDDVTTFSVPEFIDDIVTDLVAATGRDDIAVRLDLKPVSIPAEKAAPLALMVNELVTNTLKHALPPRRAGRIGVAVRQDGDRLRMEVEDDGVGMPPRPIGGSFGQNLVRMLARQLRASVTWAGNEPSGTRVSVELPLGTLMSGL
jgi:PAS domain S-box-containing protein